MGGQGGQSLKVLGRSLSDFGAFLLSRLKWAGSHFRALLSLDKLYRNIELFWYIQIATFHMVIYNSDCLHIRIYNRAAYKLKASFFKSLLILSESGVVAGMSASDLK